ncbi:MAG: hypothetical protein ACKO0Z_25485 [Betaproteobacteria bacterium]
MVKVKTSTTSVSDDTLTALVAAPGEKSFLNITKLEFSNPIEVSAGGANEFVDVYYGDELAWQQIPVPAGLGSGDKDFDDPLILPENTALKFKTTVGTATVYANAAYFVDPQAPG